MIHRIGITFILFLFLESTIASRKHLFCLINSFLVYTEGSQPSSSTPAATHPPKPHGPSAGLPGILFYFSPPFFCSSCCLYQTYSFPTISTFPNSAQPSRHLLNQMWTLLLLEPQSTSPVSHQVTSHILIVMFLFRHLLLTHARLKFS